MLWAILLKFYNQSKRSTSLKSLKESIGQTLFKDAAAIKTPMKCMHIFYVRGHGGRKMSMTIAALKIIHILVDKYFEVVAVSFKLLLLS